ncbi:MAG: DedA family protein [Oscillospiraceae bacterium]
MEFIMQTIQDYGLIAVFVLILLEYACFPLPSEVVLPFSGAVASQSGWSFLSILLFSILAGVLGALVCYLIGYFGGYPLVEKIKKKFPKSRKGLEASQQKYEKYAVLSVGLGRLIPLCRTYISFIAGISRQNLGSYLVSTAVGVAIWNSVLIGLGFLFAENWNIVTEYYNEYKLVLIPVLVVVAGFFVVRYFLKRRKKDIAP